MARAVRAAALALALRAGGERAIFGALTLAFTLAAFLAPPFSGLDTLPSLGVVLLALSVLIEDVVLAAAGVVCGIVGIALTTILGNLVVRADGGLF